MTYKSFFDLKMISLFITMTMIVIIMSRLSPRGTLDTRLFYSLPDANRFLQSLSEDGLSSYRLVEYLDLFFIYKYSRTLMLGLSRLYPGTRLFWLGIIPGTFDLIETGNIIASLHMGKPEILFPALGVVTFFKWITATALVFFIFIKLFLKVSGAPK
jgi:hypothetical protein